MRVLKKGFLSVLFLSLSISARSQHVVSGQIIDFETDQPLPFVNLVPFGEKLGTSTDIDGRFTLKSSNDIKALNLSYIGYEQIIYSLKESDNPLKLKIKLKPSAISLREVVISPGANPALRIIRKASAERLRNNPEQLHSFSYTSYNKMYVTSDMYRHQDSTNTFDNSRPKGYVQKTLEKQHLFLTESVSKRNYLRPGRNNEKVIAARVSGLKNPAFTLLATQLQSFSFYNDLITLLGKNYVNPLSKNSFSRYVFSMEDTTYQGSDSVFIISFEPKKGKNFDGLKGVLYINSNGYAIQNVIAEPANANGAVSIKVQQKYELINKTQWFPAQLNADWTYNNILLGDSSVTATNQPKEANDDDERIVAISRSYIKDIMINPELNKKDFGRVEEEVLPDAGEKPEDFWKQYRVDSLNSKESETYHVIDSIGKKANLDLKLKTISALITGIIPAKWVNLDVSRFLDFNDYEGLRVGIGGHTNERVFKRISFGGYFAEGTEDKDEKYGTDVTLLLNKVNDLKLNASYSYDVIESAGVKFLQETKLMTSEAYRRYLVIKMDKIEKKELSCSFRTFDYLKGFFFINSQTRVATDKYKFGITENGVTPLSDHFHFTEAGVEFRYLFREKFINVMNNEISDGSDFPSVYFNVTKGFKILDGDFNYNRFDLKIEKGFTTVHWGKGTAQLLAGYITGNVPYTMLYAGHGSYKRYGISVANTFETMGLNEYMSDRYAALFYTHDFGSLLYKGKKFRPEISLTTKAGFGNLRHASSHFNIPIKSLEKGYYESGVIIEKLIKFGFSGFGLAVFYRYGPYGRETFGDNAAFKFTLNLVF